MNQQELTEQAWASVESGQLAEAKTLFGQLVSLDQSDAEAWMMLGSLQGAFGEIEQALSSLQQALALEADYADAHLNLGKIQLSAGRLEAASSSIGQAVACDANLLEAWQLLGGVYGRLDAHEQAERASRRALTLSPDSGEARLHLANALLAQDKPTEPESLVNTAQPIFIVGLPRSGTSLVAGCLQACGAWLGETLPGNTSNPDGYFENRVLREAVLKAQLKQLGADPLGVKQLPRLAGQPPQPRLGGQILSLLADQGYTGTQPWLYKDAKLTLVWPLWRQVFPHARWIIVRRSAEEVIESCLRTDFMRQHTQDRAFWQSWASAYEQRLEILKASGAWYREVESGALIGNGGESLRGLVDELDLQWNAEGVARLIKPQHWHSSEQRQSAKVTVQPSKTSQCPPLIVNSVPKSGTHLLGKVFSLFGVRDARRRLNRSQGESGLITEAISTHISVGGVWPSLITIEKLAEMLLSIESGSYMQGHLPYEPRAAQLLKIFGFRMVQIIRDPRAVAVSQVRWMMDREYDPSREYIRSLPENERLSRTIRGYCFEPNGPVVVSLRRRYEHMLPWIELPEVYTVKFENLVGPEAGGDRKRQMTELSNIADHIEISQSKEQLSNIADNIFGGTMTFKGGQVNRWEELLSGTDKQLIEDEMGDIIQRLGYN